LASTTSWRSTSDRAWSRFGGAVAALVEHAEGRILDSLRHYRMPGDALAASAVLPD